MKLQLLNTLVFGLFCHSLFSQNLTNIVNKYAKVTGPNTAITAGSFQVTVDSAQFFDVPSRVLLIQMKGALASTFNGPNYGNLLNVNQAGNYEFCNVVAKSGNTITFERCLMKNYNVTGLLQLVSVPQYATTQTVSKSSSISAIRVQRPGYGYVAAPNVIIGPPPIGGIVATAKAILDPATKGIKEIVVTNPGFGYTSEPTVTFSAPPPAPYSGQQFQPAAVAIRGLTGRQWNGDVGGVLVLEVNGSLVLDPATGTIDMTGMGFRGGNVGDEGAAAPNCSPGYTNFFDGLNTGFAFSGVKGEGAFVVPSGHERGRGRSLNGGGAGIEGQSGGGGGGNYGTGGRGGASAQNPAAPVLPPSTCYSDTSKGGRAGISMRNVGYYWTKTNRIYMGGGGGGGHALNPSANTGSNFCGGYGGGIIIIRANAIVGNGQTIRANGDSAKLATDDGGSGGGAGGVIMLDCESFPGGPGTNLKLEARGGKGSNTTSLVDLTRYGPGGGGGGGVNWFSTTSVPTGVTASVTGGANGVSLNGGNNTFGALAGVIGGVLFQLDIIESKPYTDSVFVVGPVGSLPKPNFTSLAMAADFLSFKGTTKPNITINCRTAEYTDQVVFNRLSDGCATTNGTILVQSISGNKSDVKFSSVSDAIIVDDLPGLTLKNVTIYTDVATNVASNRCIQITNSSNVTLENVTVQGGFELDQTGVNTAVIKNSTLTGNVDVEASASLTLEGACKLSSKTGETVKSLTLGSGSQFTIAPASDIELFSMNWINNGAILALNNNSLKLTGTLATTLGGTAPTSFKKLDITNTNNITIGNNLTVEDWNQTSSSNVLLGSNNITINQRVTTSGGRMSSVSSGRTVCSAVSPSPVQIIGRFSNLEINGSSGAIATGAIRIDNSLTLSNGVLDMGAYLLSIEEDEGSQVTSTATSWIRGTVKQKVNTTEWYIIPIGTLTQRQPIGFTINSVSGGLQYITASFSSSDPNLTPTFSTVTPQQDGANYFSYILPDGFWTLTPDVGSANYDVSLYPSFLTGFPAYTIYKRPTATTIWDLYGILSNPAMATDLVQPDGSIRRTGLTGFSDFAVAGGEDPLPLHFIRFNARYRSGGVDLVWKMGDCQAGSLYTLYRGTKADQLSPIAKFTASQSQCDSEFEFSDGLNLPKSTRIYYQVEGKTREGSPIFSKIEAVETSILDEISPSLHYVTGQAGRFVVSNPGPSEKIWIQIQDNGGKIVYQWEEESNAELDLSFLPSGVYTAILKKEDKLGRQKIIIIQ